MTLMKQKTTVIYSFFHIFIPQKSHNFFKLVCLLKLRREIFINIIQDRTEFFVPPVAVVLLNGSAIDYGVGS